MAKFITVNKIDGVIVGEIVVEADAVEEEDDQVILTKSGAVVARFARRTVQGWWITDSPRRQLRLFTQRRETCDSAS